MNIFWGYEDFVDILWGHHKIGLYIYGSFLSIFRSFLKVNVHNGGSCFGLLKFQIFLGCLKYLIFFGVNGRCWVPAYV